MTWKQFNFVSFVAVPLLFAAGCGEREETPSTGAWGKESPVERSTVPAGADLRATSSVPIAAADRELVRERLRSPGDGEVGAREIVRAIESATAAIREYRERGDDQAASEAAAVLKEWEAVGKGRWQILVDRWNHWVVPREKALSVNGAATALRDASAEVSAKARSEGRAVNQADARSAKAIAKRELRAERDALDETKRRIREDLNLLRAAGLAPGPATNTPAGAAATVHADYVDDRFAR